MDTIFVIQQKPEFILGLCGNKTTEVTGIEFATAHCDRRTQRRLGEMYKERAALWDESGSGRVGVYRGMWSHSRCELLPGVLCSLLYWLPLLGCSAVTFPNPWKPLLKHLFSIIFHASVLSALLPISYNSLLPDHLLPFWQRGLYCAVWPPIPKGFNSEEASDILWNHFSCFCSVCLHDSLVVSRSQTVQDWKLVELSRGLVRCSSKLYVNPVSYQGIASQLHDPPWFALLCDSGAQTANYISSACWVNVRLWQKGLPEGEHLSGGGKIGILCVAMERSSWVGPSRSQESRGGFHTSSPRTPQPVSSSLEGQVACFCTSSHTLCPVW